MLSHGDVLHPPGYYNLASKVTISVKQFYAYIISMFHNLMMQ